MTQPAGQTLALSPARRYMGELVAHARRTPTLTIHRSLRLGALAKARRACTPRPSWCVLFTRAFGIVAAARPELRRVYRDWPWPHFYEHSEIVAAVAVARRLGDEPIVCFARLRQPQLQNFQELEAGVRQAREVPVAEPRGWWWTRRPTPLCGTFAVIGRADASMAFVEVLTPLTTTLTFGRVDRRGRVDVSLTFDRRVLDGATAARVLTETRQVLRDQALTPPVPAAAAAPTPR